MPNTHCLPSGSLGTKELPVPGISTSTMQVRTPSGTPRGIVVMCHGVTNGTPPPNAYVQSGAQWDALSTALVADGWLTVSPPLQEDAAVGALPISGMALDFQNDSGAGARYLASWLHEWDHIVGWIRSTYGAIPIVVCGISWGAWHALQVCANKASTIFAYLIHEPVTVITDLTVFGWNLLSTTAADVGDHALDAVTVPGLLGWGTADTTVGSTHAIAIYTNAHNAGRPITSMATSDTHGMTSGAVTTMMAYVTGTLDPLT